MQKLPSISDLDDDLVGEVARLSRVYLNKGEYAFKCEFQDTWLQTQDNWRLSPLFARSSPDCREQYRRDGRQVGCPFSIRFTELADDEPLVAWTDEWTTAIRSDNRIRRHESTVDLFSILAIAEWQQKWRDHFRNARQAQLQCRSRRLRAMLRRHIGR